MMKFKRRRNLKNSMLFALAGIVIVISASACGGDKDDLADGVNVKNEESAEKDSENNNVKPENVTPTPTIEVTPTPQEEPEEAYDLEDILAILDNARAYELSGDYKSALATIKAGLIAYPESEILQEKEIEYTKLVAQQIEKENETTPTPEPTYNYTTYYVVNCRESITLRKEPSTKAGEYCQIPLGAAVSFVKAVENGFYQVIYNGKTGYALASYLSTSKPDITVEYNPQYMYVVNCRESITLRKSPSTKAGEYCQIPLGAEVVYLEDASNGFYKVRYNGITGYALASYLSPGEDTYLYMVVVNCRESITLRKSPSTKAGEYCQIPLGAYVIFYGDAGNGFYEVEYNGIVGYALASYLTF